MRSARFVGVAAGLLVAGVALSAGPAGASTRADAHKHPKSHKHHLSPIPGVEHPMTLEKKPVVRADKAKPPAKVLVKNLVTGTGPAVTATSTVSVKYVGADYRTGKDFTQATWQSGQPASFTLHNVVPGFSSGLVGMKVGGRREIVIPPKEGYGNRAVGPIKAHETLVFVVDLESVSP